MHKLTRDQSLIALAGICVLGLVVALFIRPPVVDQLVTGLTSIAVAAELRYGCARKGSPSCW